MGGWLAVAAVATGVALANVFVIGEELFGAEHDGSLTQAQVAAELASATPSTTEALRPSASPSDPAPSESPPTDSTPSNPPASARQAFDTRGGSVVAECLGRDARVVTWTPAQGFQSRVNQKGHDVEVEFEADDAEITIEVRCADGVPAAEIDQDD